MPTFLGDDDAVPCVVVVNAEKYYSIWPSARDIPSGWSEEGFKGSRRDCLEHIARIWPEPTAHIQHNSTILQEQPSTNQSEEVK